MTPRENEPRILADGRRAEDRSVVSVQRLEVLRVESTVGLGVEGDPVRRRVEYWSLPTIDEPESILLAAEVDKWANQ